MYINENKFYEKKTLVTINSIDRIKQHKLITYINPNKVVECQITQQVAPPPTK